MNVLIEAHRNKLNTMFIFFLFFSTKKSNMKRTKKRHKKKKKTLSLLPPKTRTSEKPLSTQEGERNIQLRYEMKKEKNIYISRINFKK